MHRTRKNRRGLSVVEWTVIGSLVAGGILVGAGSLSSATNTQIDQQVNGSAGVLGRQAAAANRGDSD
jgi:hypothetical protein